MLFLSPPPGVQRYRKVRQIETILVAVLDFAVFYPPPPYTRYVLDVDDHTRLPGPFTDEIKTPKYYSNAGIAFVRSGRDVHMLFATSLVSRAFHLRRRKIQYRRRRDVDELTKATKIP